MARQIGWWGAKNIIWTIFKVWCLDVFFAFALTLDTNIFLQTFVNLFFSTPWHCMVYILFKFFLNLCHNAKVVYKLIKGRKKSWLFARIFCSLDFTVADVDNFFSPFNNFQRNLYLEEILFWSISLGRFSWKWRHFEIDLWRDLVEYLHESWTAIEVEV